MSGSGKKAAKELDGHYYSLEDVLELAKPASMTAEYDQNIDCLFVTFKDCSFDEVWSKSGAVAVHIDNRPINGSCPLVGFTINGVLCSGVDPENKSLPELLSELTQKNPNLVFEMFCLLESLGMMFYAK